MRSVFRSAVALLMCLVVSASAAAAADVKAPQKLQRLIDNYLATRGRVEKISGIALHIDIGSDHSTNVFTGTNGRDRKPIGPDTLFQIGSNTKHFTAALILKLEAEGLLSLDQTVGDWLSRYPAWANVKIRSLLNMTSDIPNYSETVPIAETMSRDLQHQFSQNDLVAAVYDQGLPVPTGYFYSNTNSVLAGLIVEAAAHMSFKDALDAMLKPLRLKNTFYRDGPYPQSVLRRLPAGIYANTDCPLYQPKPCIKTAWSGLVGKDVSRQNLSWAGPAGGMISNINDLATWVRALFTGKVIPRQQLREMMSVVSTKTGLPIDDVSDQDPAGFGLDLGRAYRPALGGAYWFYQGTTFGFRAVFAYWPQYDLVVTAMTNSQPEDADDQFAATVVGGAFQVLRDNGLVPSDANHR